MNASLDFKKIASYLKPLLPYVGYLMIIAVVGVFAYTGWVINQAFDPAPAALDQSSSGVVRFDQATLEKIKGLGQVVLEADGKSLGDSTVNPFGK